MELTRKSLNDILKENPKPDMEKLKATTDKDILKQQKEDGFDYEFTGKTKVVRTHKTALIAAE